VKAQRENLELIEKSLDSYQVSGTLNLLSLASKSNKSSLPQNLTASVDKGSIPETEPLLSDRFNNRIHKLKDRLLRTQDIKLHLNRRLFIQDNIARHRRN